MRLGLFVAVAVRQVQQAPGDQHGRAIGCDITQTHSNQGIGFVDRQFQVHLGISQDGNWFGNRRRGESDAFTI